ncbi:arginine/ornithine succinyltransferase AI subunit [Pseudomonas aeruginosa]|nr:arginine/ornithine succinyltransferase AI subunit [Pseudomonas aeruginosa]
MQSVYAELNSRGRLLFMASHPERFADAVVVEIVGYSDEQGESPFWNAVGRNFFDLNYIEAEKLSGLKSRTFLAELMAALSDLCATVAGCRPGSPWARSTRRAQITFDILMREGFETDNYIDIFDGGPTLHARTSGIRSIAQSRVVPVKIGEAPKSGRPYLVTNGQLQDFRAVVLDLDWAPGKPVALSVEAAEALGVGEGASVRLVAV